MFSGNTMNVKQFVKQIWKKYKSKGKLTFNNNSKFLEGTFRQKSNMENKFLNIKTAVILCGGRGTRLER